MTQNNLTPEASAGLKPQPRMLCLDNASWQKFRTVEPHQGFHSADQPMTGSIVEEDIVPQAGDVIPLGFFPTERPDTRLPNTKALDLVKEKLAQNGLGLEETKDVLEEPNGWKIVKLGEKTEE
jgi:hypothetical protein